MFSQARSLSQRFASKHLICVPACFVLSVTGIEAQPTPKTWRVADRPALSIGSRDGQGPKVFTYILGAVRLSSGVVVVANAGDLELRLFSPTGTPLLVSGRKGGGPGEFRSIKALHRCAGDSVFVFDPALFRLSVFGPDGAYARGTDLRKWSTNGFPPYDFWCHSSGGLAFIHRSTDAPTGEGPMRPNVRISIVRADNSVVSLGTFSASERYFRGTSIGPRPLGKQTTVGVASNSVYVGTGDTYEVAEFSLNGERIATVREAREPISVTSSQVSTYIKDLMTQDRRLNTSGYDQYFRQLEWPKVYPAYRNLIVDGLDNLWIEEYPIPGKDIRDWSVYDKVGARIATVTMPRDFRLLEIGRDYVLGVWHDELDVEYVRWYTLLK